MKFIFKTGKFLKKLGKFVVGDDAIEECCCPTDLCCDGAGPTAVAVTFASAAYVPDDPDENCDCSFLNGETYVLDKVPVGETFPLYDTSIIQGLPDRCNFAGSFSTDCGELQILVTIYTDPVTSEHSLSMADVSLWKLNTPPNLSGGYGQSFIRFTANAVNCESNLDCNSLDDCNITYTTSGFGSIFPVPPNNTWLCVWNANNEGNTKATIAVIP